jgi:hypothetical protein
MEKEEAHSMAFFLTFLPGRKRHSTSARWLSSGLAKVLLPAFYSSVRAVSEGIPHQLVSINRFPKGLLPAFIL